MTITFFFYIEDFFKAFLLTDRSLRHFGFTLLLIHRGSDDQTLDSFRKLFVKDIGCLNVSNTLRLYASNYFYIVLSWEMTRANDHNSKKDEWEFTGLNIVGW